MINLTATHAKRTPSQRHINRGRGDKSHQWENHHPIVEEEAFKHGEFKVKKRMSTDQGTVFVFAGTDSDFPSFWR